MGTQALISFYASYRSNPYQFFGSMLLFIATQLIFDIFIIPVVIPNYPHSPSIESTIQIFLVIRSGHGSICDALSFNMLVDLVDRRK